VASPEALLTALDEGSAIDPDARSAFLERHFAPGDAVGRIVARLGSATPV
jgi:hypothetical protein